MAAGDVGESGIDESTAASNAPSSRSHFSDAEALVFVLDQMPIGILLVDGSGHVVWMNASARTLIERGEGITLCDGRLEATSRGEAALLSGTVGRAVATGAGMRCDPETFTLARSSDVSPLVAVVRPVQRSGAARARNAASAVLFLSDPDHDLRTSRDRLRALFNLTPADANLVSLLAAGHSLRAAASLLDITNESARTYLKRVFERTGTRRQSELVRLALSVAAAGAADP